MLEVFAKFAGTKIKSAISDFFDHADLDGNGVVDKVQLHNVVDRTTALFTNFAKAVDYKKLMEAVNIIFSTIKALDAAIDKEALPAHIEEAKAIALELIGFAKAVLAALKAGK